MREVLLSSSLEDRRQERFFQLPAPNIEDGRVFFEVPPSPKNPPSSTKKNPSSKRRSKGDGSSDRFLGPKTEDAEFDSFLFIENRRLTMALFFCSFFGIEGRRLSGGSSFFEAEHGTCGGFFDEPLIFEEFLRQACQRGRAACTKRRKGNPPRRWEDDLDEFAGSFRYAAWLGLMNGSATNQLVNQFVKHSFR